MDTRILGIEQKRSLSGILRKHPHVISAYQFGSTVSGTDGPLSDLDIALLVDNKNSPPDTDSILAEGLLCHQIARSLKASYDEVDVKYLNGSSLLFQHTVIRTGNVIYDANPEVRRLYEWKIIQAYLDFEPTLRWMGQFQKDGWLRRCGVR